MMPHTSPSGSQELPPPPAVGLVQKPMGGLVPATIWQRTVPAPGRPEPAAPQQSESCLQVSPWMRQPPASWHTDAPEPVSAQTRLQHAAQPGHTSPSMAQLPMVEMAVQVPAVWPDGMVQLPLQQSPPAKQTSPSGWQPAAVVMHTPPLQFLEQQSALVVQALPSVVQPPATTGAQLPLAQLPLQQSLPALQVALFCAQAVAQLPETQLRPQHCTDEVQATPWARQPPTVPVVPPMTQVCVVPSQVPTQQSPLTLQVCAGATQELLTPPSPPPVPPAPPPPPLGV
jgi:hypothetical protein